MVDAVIFDFYGTLARWADTRASSYTTVFARFGYTLEPAVLDDYFFRYDGVAHAEHSVSEEAYEAWVRSRLYDLTGACGVEDADAEDIIGSLRDSDQGRMIAYPEAAATLAALRDAGLTVGVCSNWGWELNAYLDQVGLLHLVDAAVTSARAERASRIPTSTPGRRSRSVPTRGASSSSATRGNPTSGVRGGWA